MDLYLFEVVVVVGWLALMLVVARADRARQALRAKRKELGPKSKVSLDLFCVSIATHLQYCERCRNAFIGTSTSISTKTTE